MRSHNYTSLSDVTNLLSKSCLCADFKDSSKEHFVDNPEGFDESIYDFDGLEEVFTEHILMDNRLRKTLYAGDFDGLEDLPDHPPLALTGLALELFSKAVPNYGLDILDMDYVSAASEAARISPCAMIIAMIYLERLQLKNSEYLETVSPPGLFVVTMLVASKFLFEDEEDIVTNQMWAEALNFDVKDLNSLERDFLSAMDWKVFVDSSEYFCYLCGVEKEIALKQSSLRNWLTYGDMYVMLQDPAFQYFWKACLKRILKATLLWTFGYVATALALYSTGIAVQKLKPEKNHSPDLIIKNNTMELHNSVYTTVKNFCVDNELSADTEFIDNDYFLPSLVFEISHEESERYNPQNRNCYSSCLFLFKRKVSIYRLEVTKSSNKLRMNSGDNFLRKESAVNDSYINSVDWFKSKRNNRCTSVLMR